MTYDIVHHPNHCELTLDEALGRLVKSFPRLIVDRFRGVDLRKCWGGNCGSLCHIDAVKYNDPAHWNKIAWVSIQPEKDSESVEFVLEDQLDFFFKYSSDESRKIRRTSIQKVAEALGYEITKWPVFIEVNIGFDCDISESSNLMPLGFTVDWELTFQTKLREAFSESGIDTDVGFSLQNDDIRTTVICDDDELGKIDVEEAILSVFPDAIISFEFRPDSLPRC